MLYPIQWGRMELLLEKRFSATEISSPAFYYESDMELYIYTKQKGADVYSVKLLSDIEDLRAWKMKYLGDAEEMPSRPTDNIHLIIKQV